MSRIQRIRHKQKARVARGRVKGRGFSWLRRAVKANRRFKWGRPGSWKRGNKRLFRR